MPIDVAVARAHQLGQAWAQAISDQALLKEQVRREPRAELNAHRPCTCSPSALRLAEEPDQGVCRRTELTRPHQCVTVSPVVTKPSVSIKELHQQTGEIVRASAQSAAPIAITERGKIIAYLAAPPLVNMKRPKRVLLPGYAAMMKNPPSSDVLKALDEDRGEY